MDKVVYSVGGHFFIIIWVAYIIPLVLTIIYPNHERFPPGFLPTSAPLLFIFTHFSITLRAFSVYFLPLNSILWYIYKKCILKKLHITANLFNHLITVEYSHTTQTNQVNVSQGYTSMILTMSYTAT